MLNKLVLVLHQLKPSQDLLCLFLVVDLGYLKGLLPCILYRCPYMIESFSIKNHESVMELSRVLYGDGRVLCIERGNLSQLVLCASRMYRF